MSILDQDLGFREITVAALGSIGFKPTKVNLWINGVRVYPYDLFIEIPGISSWSGKRHLVRYFPGFSNWKSLKIRMHGLIHQIMNCK